MTEPEPAAKDESVAAKLTLRARKPDIRAAVPIIVALIAGYGASHAVDVAGNAQGSAASARSAAQSAQQAAMSASAYLGQVKALEQRLSRDEHASCLIEARGLPAGHALVGIMADIHVLLTRPPTRAERRAERHEPRKVRLFLDALNGNLATYTRLEAAQPHSRKC